MKNLFIMVFLLVLLLVSLTHSNGLAVQGDIVFNRKAQKGGTPPAVFPHWFHRIRYKCYVCHPGIFKMKAGANKITMDAIGKGKYCGTCHNGKIAWPMSFQNCSRCHLVNK